MLAVRWGRHAPRPVARALCDGRQLAGPLLAVTLGVATAIPALSPSLTRFEPTESDRQPTPGAGAAFERALSGASGPRVVAAVRTKLDSGQASAALREAYRNVTGEEPSEGTVRVLTAQWAHETGQGASMFNYNFGGIKGTGPSGLSVAQRTREGFGATERTIVDRFRAYTTPAEGATDYVKLLSTRFPEALQSAKNADPVGFVQGLKSRGYFTGDPAAYTRSVVSLSGMAIPESYAAAPTLSARALNAAPRAQAASSRYEPSYALPGGVTPALIDGMALADEISRAALRIAAATKPSGERR